MVFFFLTSYVRGGEIRMKGIVKFYDIRKGYGFIRGDDGKTIFVHRSAIPFFDIFLLPGEIVEYTINASTRGPQAVDVKKL
jgi:CspA family cold shock protein